MKTQPKKSQARSPRQNVGKVFRQLLDAVDQSIAAADRARAARDTIVALSLSHNPQADKGSDR